MAGSSRAEFTSKTWQREPEGHSTLTNTSKALPSCMKRLADISKEQDILGVGVKPENILESLCIAFT